MLKFAGKPRVSPAGFEHLSLFDVERGTRGRSLSVSIAGER